MADDYQAVDVAHGEQTESSVSVGGLVARLDERIPPLGIVRRKLYSIGNHIAVGDHDSFLPLN